MSSESKIQSQIGSQAIALAIPGDVTEIRLGGARSQFSIEQLLTESLRNPLEYPCILDAIVPGDRIAIAIESGLPMSESVVAELIQFLVANEIPADSICVVLGTNSAAWKHQIETAIATRLDGKFDATAIQIINHVPGDMPSHGYIAAAESADPIYIQRQLFEADVVIPIYCVRTADSPSASDKYGISPGFADAATQHRWNLAWLEDNAHHLHQQTKLSHEAGWLMGIQFAIAIIPACDGTIANVCAGKPESVFAKANQSIERSTVTTSDSDGDYDLVVALVEGDASQQSWMNVARAIAHADAQCSTNGVIAVCSDLEEISDGIAQLTSDEQDGKLQRRLLKSDMEDAFAAAVIRSVQSKRSVYLMSRLSSPQIESMGLAYLATAADILRLRSHTGHSDLEPSQSKSKVCVIRAAQF